jgi:hypothetical protein
MARVIDGARDDRLKALLNQVLARLGYALVGTKTRSAEHFVVCMDAHGEVEESCP